MGADGGCARRPAGADEGPWAVVDAPDGCFLTCTELVGAEVACTDRPGAEDGTEPGSDGIGLQGSGVVRARGIRYARAARFGAPQPYSYREETEYRAETEQPTDLAGPPDSADARHPAGDRGPGGGTRPVPARTPAPACPQRHGPQDTELRALGFDEHCQRLSITRPDDARRHLPVLVWIHGGSFTGGAGDLPHYDPSALVREQGLVVVSVTYRLGLFGYLGDGTERAANPALLDQAEALRWVHRNIAAFGGDPGNITLAGQSTGGQSCWDLLLLPGIAGLVRRAVVQSAPLGIVHGRGRAWERLVPPAEETEALRRMPAAELAELEHGINLRAMRCGRAAFMPFSTRYIAPLPEEDQLAERWAGLAGEVELLMGTTARETGLFIGSVAPVRALARTAAGRRWLVEPLVRWSTRAIYSRPTARWARAFHRAGGTVTLYRLGAGRARHPMRAVHESELPLLFPHPVWATGTEDIGTGVSGPQLLAGFAPGQADAVGAALRQAWGRFARGEGTGAEPAPAGTAADTAGSTGRGTGRSTQGRRARKSALPFLSISTDGTFSATQGGY